MKKIDEDKKRIVDVASKLGFSGKSFLVTGATGMLGKILVNSLQAITNSNNIFVLGLNQKETEAVFCDSAVNKTTFGKLKNISRPIDYIIHLASPTNPVFLKENAVETISFIYESTKEVLDFAMKHASRVLYVSSMEVYGEIYDEEPKFESDLGFVNLGNTRSSYPEAKRLCELLCYAYSKQYNLNVYTARLSQTFGAGTPYSDSRIFGYLGRCVVNETNIILKTTGDTFGNYCYIADTISAFFYILARGVSGETYNVVGDNCRKRIFDLAMLVSKEVAKGKIDVQIAVLDNNQYPNPTKLNMSNAKIKGLGWKPNFCLKDMFERMIASWQE